jgi:hypothetical protein
MEPRHTAATYSKLWQREPDGNRTEANGTKINRRGIGADRLRPAPIGEATQLDFGNIWFNFSRSRRPPWETDR